MTARFIVGDTRAVTATIPDGSVDLILTSPPFLALRSYLPADHESKHLEIGSESNPAAFIDVLLELTAEWRRILAPHGSLVVELGDSYAGSGGSGGDYAENGWREGQPKFGGSARVGWPLPKCLAMVPELYRVALAYGLNPLTGRPSPAGLWRVRNVVRFCRPNPAVGFLGDKFRPATSDLVVACTASDRWFDLDAVRTEAVTGNRVMYQTTPTFNPATKVGDPTHGQRMQANNPAGAPPLDWWQIASNPSRSEHAEVLSAVGRLNELLGQKGRAAIEHAIELLEAGPGAPNDWWQIVPGGYSGAHYAVWPPQLCERPIEAMCPRRVCLTCGRPSRRITGEATYIDRRGIESKPPVLHHGGEYVKGDPNVSWSPVRTAPTVGWSTCGCPNTDGLTLDGYHSGLGWRPGIVLDPFAGSGTTLVVAHGHSRDSIGIDLDPRNADLAAERLGMFLETTYHNNQGDNKCL